MPIPCSIIQKIYALGSTVFDSRAKDNIKIKNDLTDNKSRIVLKLPRLSLAYTMRQKCDNSKTSLLFTQSSLSCTISLAVDEH